MAEYFNNRKGRPRVRTRSLCARCGKVREEPQDLSPGRSSWADKGRDLSIEVDGREGRRRHSSSENISGNKKGSSMHCYMVPVSNGHDGPFTRSSTTYRESFRQPSSLSFSRHAASTPSSPLSASSMWPTQAYPRTTHNLSSRHSFSQADSQVGLSSQPARSNSRDGNWHSNTTYRDHFTWLS